MKASNLLLVILFIVLMITPVIAANVSVQPRVYFSEDTAVPIEVWMMLILIAISLLILAIVTYYKTLLGLLAFGFFAAAAFTAPVVGYFNSVVLNNTSASDGSYEFVPTIHLATQPWVMWFLWGMALISFLIMVWGILVYFKEVQDVEESGKWI